MSDKNTNPFVLPGMGQSSDLSGNPLLTSMEMMRQAWAGLTGPGGLTQSLPMASPTNLEDLEKRIAELRSVESWLSMNLSMLTSTIQGMEVQRSTIATLRSFVDSVSNMDKSAAIAPGGPSPLEIVLGLKPAPQAQAKAEPKPAPAGAGAQDGAAQAGAAAGEDPAAQLNEQLGVAANASRAWWDLMQQQFTQIASATAASMPAADDSHAAAAPKAQAKAAPAAAEKTSPKPAAAKTAAAPRKTAAKKSSPRPKS